MPAPRLYVTTRAGTDIDLTMAQADQLIANGVIELCGTCDVGTHHVRQPDSGSDARLKDAIDTLGGAPSSRVFVPISSAWN